MILGIGCDIVSIERFKNILDKTPAFLKRVYSENEIREYNLRGNSISYLASRFAAKEAIVKSLKEYNYNLNTIEILNGSKGEPIVKIQNMEQVNIELSLSYEKDYVIAYAILLSI